MTRLFSLSAQKEDSEHVAPTEEGREITNQTEQDVQDINSDWFPVLVGPVPLHPPSGFFFFFVVARFG